MKRYESYKQSGILWIGEIPSHWEEKRLSTKFHDKVSPNSDYRFSHAHKFNYGILVPKNEGGDVSDLKETYLAYNVLQPNDIVINGLNLNYDFVSQRVAIANEDCIITGAYLPIRPFENTYAPYYLLLLKAMDSKKLFHGMGSGIRLTLSFNELKAQPIPVPPLEEQKKIVEFLSTKTSLIDEQLREKERELRLLDELKQAEIANVVTRGLNPDVPMKDSGIPWIGQIPAHWEVSCLRKFLKIFSEKGHPDKALLSVTREQGVIIRNTEDKEENHNFIPDDLSGYKLVKKGQFVVNKMKSWQGSYGVSEYEGIVSPAYYVCDLNYPYKLYFSLAIRSKAYVPFFTQMSKGIRVDQWDLSIFALKSIPFIIPPIEEQKAIVEYIQQKNTAIDEMIANLRAEIDFLTEYKQRLVADVVTGQVNVQNL